MEGYQSDNPDSYRDVPYFKSLFYRTILGNRHQSTIPKSATLRNIKLVDANLIPVISL
jgi:hypothetical protein